MMSPTEYNNSFTSEAVGAQVYRRSFTSAQLAQLQRSCNGANWDIKNDIVCLPIFLLRSLNGFQGQSIQYTIWSHTRVLSLGSCIAGRCAALPAAPSPILLPVPSGLKSRSDSPVVDLGAACWGHFNFGSQTGLAPNEY